MNKKEEIIKLLNKYGQESEMFKAFVTEDEFSELADDIVKLFAIPVVTCRFLSADEKVEHFKKELKALLVKYDAELTIEDFGRDWSSDEKIVVNFNWDEDLANRTGNGIVPDWVVGRWENGR